MIYALALYADETLMPPRLPDRSFEDSLFDKGYAWIIGVDEVGRGCLAYDVGIGAVAMSRTAGDWPKGLRDSKLVPEKSRQALRDEADAWLPINSVGFASADEIEEYGINPAQALAGERAIAKVIKGIEAESKDFKVDRNNTIIILDGSSNWLKQKIDFLDIIVKVKADQDCVVVSAASILAKVTRDNALIELDKKYPLYGFAKHKGYGSPLHYEAIAKHGIIPGIHRASWIK